MSSAQRSRAHRRVLSSHDRETDPSKIVVGFAGTVDMVAGLGFLTAVVGRVAVPFRAAQARQPRSGRAGGAGDGHGGGRIAASVQRGALRGTEFQCTPREEFSPSSHESWRRPDRAEKRVISKSAKSATWGPRPPVADLEMRLEFPAFGPSPPSPPPRLDFQLISCVI